MADKSALEHYKIHQYGALPLSFEPNRHQLNQEFEFLTRGANYTLLLQPDIATLKFSHGTDVHNVELQFQGANTRATMRGLEALPGEANYFAGNREDWITHVPTFGKVKVDDVYPGIDVSYYGNPGRLEYDFIVKPGATPDRIDVAFKGVSGFRLADGDLLMSTGNKEIRQKKPIVYQEVDGTKHFVDASYILRDGDRVGFDIRQYDHRRPLIIDPQLIYSLSFGIERPLGVAVDTNGNVYICGEVPDSVLGDKTTDAFVVKLNAAGTAIIYRNTFGVARVQDTAYAIAADASGNAYVTGYTAANGPGGATFPTVNPIQPVQPTTHDVAFVTKFGPTGTMLYSTVLGGNGFDFGQGIAVDTSGNMFVAGQTSSTNFPTSHPLQATLNGPSDAFVTALNAHGNAFIFSTYVGGSRDDGAKAIAIDSTGNSYVSGLTSSSDFPTANAIVPTAGGGGFAFKLNPSGSAFQYSTYLGEGGANGIAVDSSGDAYAGGTTGNPSKAYVKKINSAGSAFIYSVYVGGSSGNTGNAISVDAAGNAYLTGSTTSSDFPQVGSLETFIAGSADAFLTKLSTTGTIVYSTLLAANSRSPAAAPGAVNIGQGVASDSNGNVYVTGPTDAWNFPTTPSPVNSGSMPVNSGFGSNGFLVKLTDDQPSSPIQLIQSNAVQGSRVASVSVPFPSSNTAGNLIIAFVRMSTTSDTVKVTDSAGNVYTDAVSQAQTADGSQVHIFYAKNITGGSNTVTATISETNNHPWLAIYEYGGLSTTNPVDQVARAQGNSNSPASGLITTTSNSELAFAATGLPASYTGGVTAGNGNTMQLQDTGTSRAANETAALASAGSQYSGRFSLSSGANWSVVVATFVAAGPLHITTQTLPNGALNTMYSVKLAATGGKSPYSWAVVSNDFPSGLSLDSSSGVLSGSPSQSGQFTFTVKVTDAASHTSYRFFNLFIPFPGAITTVQTNSIQGTAVGSVSLPFKSNNQPGNLIVAFVRMSTTWETVSVTDSAGNVYTDAASQGQTADGSQIHVFYAKNIAGGANTVTATFSSTNNHPWLAIFEYSGLSTTNPVDQTAHAQGASTSPNSGLITTTTGNELLFEATGLPASFTGTVTWNSMAPAMQDTGTSRAAIGTITTNHTGQYTAQFNLSSTANWSAVIVAFKQ